MNNSIYLIMQFLKNFKIKYLTFDTFKTIDFIKKIIKLNNIYWDWILDSEIVWIGDWD